MLLIDGGGSVVPPQVVLELGGFGPAARELAAFLA